MKKYLLLLLTYFFLFSLLSQDIIIPEQIKEFNRKEEIARDNMAKFRNNPDDIVLLENALESFNEIFRIDIPEYRLKLQYSTYAFLLALSGDFSQAIEYYDLAFDLKQMTAKQFENWYDVKQVFEKDPFLYNEKKKEYYEQSNYNYSARERELLMEVTEIFTADQFARNYYIKYPESKNCSKNIIMYADSITMVKWIDLLKKYPEYNNPLEIYPIANLAMSRHIFTAYPDFWLTYYEPTARKLLLTGEYDPLGYARTYDRCIITSGKAEYSYYGEWDNDGKNVNPDSEAVDKRRENLGLPLLKDKPSNEGKFFITY